ncbi:MAG TPA: PhoU domain-containing protein [Candidatus Acidoferrales bacterium]|nr:PhoU domain-containing protein [Candidatus Acidoferrales bacterium]
MSDVRKIQQTPTGTFFVCLPRDWAKESGLQKGSQVNLEVTSDGKLFVDTQFGAEPEPKAVSLKVGPYLSREIVGRYLLGYDIIKVEAKDRIDSNMRNLIKNTANSLAGLMIVEETTSMMTLQCLMQQPFTSPEKILQRNQASTVRMIRDAASSFVTSDLDLAKNVIERDVENNKFYFLLVRILRTILQNPRLSEKLAIVPIECLDYRLIAGFIEGIGDACVEMAHNTLELDGTKLSDELHKLLLELQSRCVEANENAFKSFLSKDIALAENVRSLRGKIDDNCSQIEAAAKDSSVDLMPQILAAVSFLRQIYERSVDMADLVV